MDKRAFAKQRLKERKSKNKTFSFPEGETTFRLLPNAKGVEKPEYVEFGMHSSVGPQKNYLRCGQKNDGSGDCWLCNKLAEMSESKKSSHRAAAEAMKRVDKFAVQIAVNDDGMWVGPTLCLLPGGVANGLLGILHRKDVAHPQKGYNLTIDRTGTTFKGTKYGSILVDDEKSEVSKKILGNLKPFGEVLMKYDEAKQKAAFFGHDQEEEVEEEEEETEKEEETEEEEEETKPAAKKAGKKPPKEEEEEEPDEEDSEFGDLEEEEGEEEEESSEEEEEEKPKAGKKTAKKPPKEEEEPAEEEEEEENEEETEEEEPAEEEEEDDEPKKPAGKKPKPGKTVKKPAKPADDDDDE